MVLEIIVGVVAAVATSGSRLVRHNEVGVVQSLSSDYLCIASSYERKGSTVTTVRVEACRTR